MFLYQSKYGHTMSYCTAIVHMQTGKTYSRKVTGGLQTNSQWYGEKTTSHISLTLPSVLLQHVTHQHNSQYYECEYSLNVVNWILVKIVLLICICECPPFCLWNRRNLERWNYQLGNIRVIQILTSPNTMPS